jgi:hypothetical protein
MKFKNEVFKMNEDTALAIYLQTWQSVYLKPSPEGGEEKVHLSEKVLYQMALSSGINDADPKDSAHLSLCPLCLNQWAEFRKSISDIEDAANYKEQRFVAWGMLEAAAGDKPVEAVRLKSSCGRFYLGLLPQMGNPENGMITLELESKTASELEGHKVTVRDNQGRILLEGALCQGRLARRIEKLPNINLKHWTVVVD